MKRFFFMFAVKMAERSLRVRIREPENLYELCLTNLVNYVHKSKCDKDDLHALPDSVLMDVYYKMLDEKRLCNLGAELSQLDIFQRLLRYTAEQNKLLECFQAVIDHGSKLPTELATAYAAKCASSQDLNKVIRLGLRLGGFLNEAGWYADAETVLLQCRKVCQDAPQTTYFKRLTLECCHRLLNTQSSYCCFPAAAETYAMAMGLLGLKPGTLPPFDTPLTTTSVHDQAVQTDEQTNDDEQFDEDDLNVGSESVEGMYNLTLRLYKEFSSLFFVKCDYSAAYAWGMEALRLLKPDTPPKMVVEVSRLCGKACVVKRKFVAGGLLARHAVAVARARLGPRHPRLATALLDYGFYLLNVDSITHSVAVYEEALQILRRVFGRVSLHVATAQEDLAYALYVLEYSTGRFYRARDHAERAIRIIENLVPRDHLLLASAKRVKALILEEIALDTPAGGQVMSEPGLLEESEALHKTALKLSMLAFGEKNVQTAKHYGNLGRLYQSMQKFEDAETMLLKAISIKEELLGTEDYDVGLSVGHLASLYNYHMHMYSAAEKLYFRSISISLKLFGERYSGLEYDYRGLVHVFTQLKKHDRAHFYNTLLHQWHELREQSKGVQQPALGDEQALPLDDLREQVFAESH